jgi:hypothetical protein
MILKRNFLKRFLQSREFLILRTETVDNEGSPTSNDERLAEERSGICIESRQVIHMPLQCPQSHWMLSLPKPSASVALRCLHFMHRVRSNTGERPNSISVMPGATFAG